MPDPDWQPQGAPTQGNRFTQKLGTYLLGVAIGLAFLGWIQYRKHLAGQSQTPASPAAPEPTPGPVSGTPAP